MSQDTQAFLLVAAFVVPFALIIFLILRFKKRRREAYETFAARHGLEYLHSSWPMMTGKIDGREFFMGLDRLRSVSGRAKRGPEQAAAMLVGGIELRDVPEGLIVVRKGLIEKAMKSDVITNDPVFDKKCLVKCPNPDAAMAYLTAERRARLVEITSKKVSLEDGQLSYGPAGGKLSNLDHLEEFSQRFFGSIPLLDGDGASRAAASAPSAAATTSAPATDYSAEAASGTPAAVSVNPAIGAAWMAGTVFVVAHVGMWLHGYFTILLSTSWLVQLVVAAGIGFFAAAALDLSKPAVAAVVAVVAWLLSSLVFAVFSGDIAWAIHALVNTMGILQIVLAAASGAGMVFFLRKRSEGLEL